MNDFSISVCFTTFNRTEMLFQACEPFIKDPRVSEICISDDCSEMGVSEQIFAFAARDPKIKYKRQTENLGCYRNKMQAVMMATNEWVCLLDSDNLFSKTYVDRIENLMIAGVNPKTLYQPDFAKPHFDFRKYSGINFTRGNVSRHVEDSTFCTMLNAMNYFVNAQEFIRVWENRAEPWTADSLLQNYNWLNAGNSIYVVPDFQYEHRVHEGSHYKEHFRKTGNLYNELVHKLRLMTGEGNKEPFGGKLPPYDYQLDN